jgi:hypothetical protein
LTKDLVGAEHIFRNRPTSIRHGEGAKVVAAFKDPRTIEAVSNAPPIVRLFLEEAGFGLKSVSSVKGACGRDDAAANMRKALVGQLSAALSNRAMKKALGRAAHESAFNINAFIATVISDDAHGFDDAPEQDAAFKPTTHGARVTPRRPGDLRRKGVKSRTRPH